MASAGVATIVEARSSAAAVVASSRIVGFDAVRGCRRGVLATGHLEEGLHDHGQRCYEWS